MESAAAASSDASRLCEGGCGFFGSPQLMFFCSVCFKKTHGEEEFKRRTLQAAEKKENASDAQGTTLTSVSATPPATTAAANNSYAASPGGAMTANGAAAKAGGQAAGADIEQAAAQGGQADKLEAGEEPVAKKMAPSRCMSCKKKVGLLGFHCRCGGTFCEKHRYSDKHDCSFDYKAHGRDQLAKDNSACVAEKMEKI